MQRRSRLAVIAAALLALGLEGSASSPPPDGLVSAFRWTMPDRNFGGFSGLEVSDDGMRFVTLGDQGVFVQGQIVRDAQGAITGIKAGKATFLKTTNGPRFYDEQSDSEGLALAPDGSFYVSFEGEARVLRYPAIEDNAQTLSTPRAFAAFPLNAALEALAVDASGALFTFPEELAGSRRLRIFAGQPGNPTGPDFPVWRYAKGVWTQPFTLRRDGSFLPVGADFGPDGRLYVLERAFRGIAGFASRVRSFRVAARGLLDEKTHLTTSSGLFDNLEGLSVWRDARGDIRLTMISDDNFMPFQRTEIVEYRLRD